MLVLVLAVAVAVAVLLLARVCLSVRVLARLISPPPFPYLILQADSARSAQTSHRVARTSVRLPRSTDGTWDFKRGLLLTMHCALLTGCLCSCRDHSLLTSV